MTNQNTQGRTLRVCAIDDLEDPGSCEFEWGEGGWPLGIFVVRRGDEVFGYLNRCPHAGHALNWQPDRFLTKERDLILCQSHGARFTLDEGLCVLGPCPGASLRTVPLQLNAGEVLVELDDLEQLKAEIEV
jgi:nitrite reductase/ring-hydroxylating ferredoxin subunit